MKCFYYIVLCTLYRIIKLILCILYCITKLCIICALILYITKYLYFWTLTSSIEILRFDRRLFHYIIIIIHLFHLSFIYTYTIYLLLLFISSSFVISFIIFIHVYNIRTKLKPTNEINRSIYQSVSPAFGTERKRRRRRSAEKLEWKTISTRLNTRGHIRTYVLVKYSQQ